MLSICLGEIITTGIALSLKIVDTRYDNIFALGIPLFKLLVPFMMAIRDARTSVKDVKS